MQSGTSETIRDNTENIKNISIHVPTHLKPLKGEQFGHYLAGLIDGGGHFSSKQQLVIVFSSPDVKLAYYIKKVIGFGNVKKVKDKNFRRKLILKYVQPMHEYSYPKKWLRNPRSARSLKKCSNMRSKITRFFVVTLLQ